MEFSEMHIEKKILDAIKHLGFEKPTEIQEKAIPIAIEGKDIIGQAMTGSGKTLVFGITILQNVEPGNGPQALVLAPTRELADQIADHIRKLAKYTRAKIVDVFGGVSIEPQIRNLRDADVVVGTPGRILDHMDRRTIDLRNVRIFVLDEADRMLDMGFIDDIKEIMHHLPRKRQNLLFSATIPDEVHYITKHYMNNPVKVKAEVKVSKQKLKQYYYDVRESDKLSLLVHSIKKEKPELAIIFCSTRATTDLVADVLQQNDIEAKPIHGGMTQHARTSILAGFHKGRPHVLVATDVAARGLDIQNVSHVFNYELPQTVDDYTHRIGRTARIGKEGSVITLLSKEDHDIFRKIIRVNEVKKLPTEEFPRIKYAPPRREYRERTFRRPYPGPHKRLRFKQRHGRH